MMKNKRGFTRSFGSVLLLVLVFSAGFVFGTANRPSEAQRFALGDVDQAFEPFWESFSAIQTRFVDSDEFAVPDLVDGAISGMVDSLGDRNSLYYSPRDYDAFNDGLSGDVQGIGVTINTDDDSQQIEVVSVISGAPADDAGVLPGDIFWEVNGQNVVGVEQGVLVDLVRGPSGTEVVITFKRGEDFVEFNITRAAFEVPNVSQEVFDNNIGYISMEQFSNTAYSQLENALEDIDVNERDGFILDLRGNPGGLLSSAVNIGSMFIEEGVLLYETFGDGREEIFNVLPDNFFGVDVPMVVLVDEGSASASELVSGALQDFDVATVIGEVTFGKGTVQNVQPLSNGGGLRLTVARYLLPNREWIHEVGVTPDFIVEYDPATDGIEVDPQLDAAMNYILTGSIQ